MKPLALVLSGFLLSGLFFTSVSCQKDTDCKANVICLDSTGRGVAGAEVLLYATVKDPNDPKGQATYTADVKANGTTDGSGEVQFVFKLPAIYDIKATGKIGSRTITGNSIIKLEEGKSVEKRVTLR